MNLSKKNTIFLSIVVLTFIILFVSSPAKNLEACMNGLLVWATSIAPALFPFLIFTKLLSELNFIETLSKYLSPITRKLYHTPGISAYIYTMSILSGYPVGAKLTADFYEKGLISYGQACRITTFTSTSGPLFIVGTVGIGMLHSGRMGIIILLSHFIGAILNGLIYRNYMYDKVSISSTIDTQSTTNKNLLEDIMFSSIKSILIIGGYVAIFFVIITMLNNAHILYPIEYFISKIFSLLHIPTQIVSPMINGIIEVTKGCLDVSTISIPPITKCAICTFLISFGGISIHMQALTFIKRFHIKTSFYILQKVTHAILSTIISIPLYFLI